MKKILASFALALCAAVCAFPQASVNYFPDSLSGTYLASQKGDEFKVSITADPDGVYTGRIIWLKDSVNPATGEKLLDTKNPDKSLRSVPCDQIVLLRGLKYDSEKKCWNGGKIYDPQRGINANATLYFEVDGRLCVKGTVGLISEKVYWKKID